jgi:transcriptional regulator with XRE-family HTH domain
MTNPGHHLRQARLAAGFSQKQLGDAIGVDHTHVSGVESGRRKLTVGVAYQAERVLGCEHDSLVRHAEDLSDTVRSLVQVIPGYLCRLRALAADFVAPHLTPIVPAIL